MMHPNSDWLPANAPRGAIPGGLALVASLFMPGCMPVPSAETPSSAPPARLSVETSSIYETAAILSIDDLEPTQSRSEESLPSKVLVPLGCHRKKVRFVLTDTVAHWTPRTGRETGHDASGSCAAFVNVSLLGAAACLAAAKAAARSGSRTSSKPSDAAITVPSSDGSSAVTRRDEGSSAICTADVLFAGVLSPGQTYVAKSSFTGDFSGPFFPRLYVEDPAQQPLGEHVPVRDAGETTACAERQRFLARPRKKVWRAFARTPRQPSTALSRRPPSAWRPRRCRHRSRSPPGSRLPPRAR
ncbi:MAG: hypothetical protein JW751_11300 [Polyangiaceae bacterium]|nr:hypothetical protein [Polyangiaceae bacterium]